MTHLLFNTYNQMNVKMIWMAIAALFLGGNTRANSTNTHNPDPRALTIYQIMVASYQHGDGGGPGYKAMWGPDDARKNGNLRGIINALDSIKSLGVNAIWLTPIFDSTEAGGGEKLQATGYFTNNFFKIDPNFGTEEDFQELVDKAHDRGLYVILDGVFGHHGGVTLPSPSGHTLDTRWVFSDRGEQGGSGNIAYPGSLDYIKEVATYWIDRYGIDGWRLDQAYQATQGGHNYWNEIRGAVDSLTQARRERGEKWGILGYMVGEDWGDADVINRGVYRDGGLLSAFDFDGKELISGPMQSNENEGLQNGWNDVITVLSPPTSRGYLNDDVMPNLFLSNHDGYRLADHFSPYDPLYYEKMMTRYGILASYSGPITLYYGDEYADRTLETTGGQKDNVARTSGHLGATNPGEVRLKIFVAEAMKFRADNPAMWRGTAQFRTITMPDGANVLIVDKTDPVSSNRVAIIFTDADTTLPAATAGNSTPLPLKAYIPHFVNL